MAIPIFISGIGTGVGKTIVSAIVAQALEADYWKPIQAGFDEGTDSEWVASMLSNPTSIVHPELYKLKMAASPHIAAREEQVSIDIDDIANQFFALPTFARYVVVEGAGGLLVPINEKEFIINIIEKLQAKVILVSRNYLGSINHSLMAAEVCKARSIDIAGWIFNDRYMDYEAEVELWSGIQKLGNIPFSDKVSKEFIEQQARILAPVLQQILATG